MWLLGVLACAGGPDSGLTDTEETDADWELIHRIGVEISFSFPSEDVRSIHLLGAPWAATTRWILLGDDVTVDVDESSVAYRIAAGDDEDWDAYFDWFTDRDGDPFAVRIEGTGEDQSKYSVFEDADIGLDVAVLDGWEVLGIDWTRTAWEEWEDGTVFTGLQFYLRGVPDGSR